MSKRHLFLYFYFMKKNLIILLLFVFSRGFAQEIDSSLSSTEGKIVDAELNDYRTVSGLEINRFVGANFTYPPEALENEITGTINIEFIVEKDGTVKDVKVVQGVCDVCDAEAVRVIKKLVFNPIEMNGKTERIRFRLPIRMLLE